MNFEGETNCSLSAVPVSVEKKSNNNSVIINPVALKELQQNKPNRPKRTGSLGLFFRKVSISYQSQSLIRPQECARICTFGMSTGKPYKSDPCKSEISGNLDKFLKSWKFIKHTQSERKSFI